MVRNAWWASLASLAICLYQTNGVSEIVAVGEGA